MSISLQLIDPISDIEKKINAALADLVNDVILNNLDRIKNEVNRLIPSWISSQPEIQSLSSNTPLSLVGQFGITDNTQVIINNIISSVVSSTEVKFVKYKANFTGGLELGFQPANFSNLLALPAGHTIHRGGDLHWLDWLLKRGDQIIVANYQYNPQTGLGRSGLGNMIQEGSFRVPPEFSGTEQNNFITRAFIGQTQQDQITEIFKKVLK